MSAEVVAQILADNDDRMLEVYRRSIAYADARGFKTWHGYKLLRKKLATT